MLKNNRKQKGKNKGILIVSISLIAFVLLVGGIFYGLYTLDMLPWGEKAKPDKTISEYMDYVSQGDYDGMYNLLTEASQKNMTREDFIERNKKIYEGIEAKNIKAVITGVVEESRDQSTVTYTNEMETLTGSISFNNSAVLTKNKEHEFRIEWKSELIFPELASDYKVSIRTLSGTRGEIFDRNDMMLAGNGTASSIGLVPGKMNKDSDADLKKIAKILDISVENIQKKLGASYVKADSFVPIKTVSASARTQKDKLLTIPGIKITDTKARIYPYGEIIAHLTGYVQNINAEELEEKKGENYSSTSVLGKSGLEKIYEDKIRGIDGKEILIVDESGNKVTTLSKRDPVNGEDLKLTIDIKVQGDLYHELKSDKSSTVAMNPKTGEVLALVSTPSYDPNDFVLGISQTKWDQLNNDKDKPFYNRYQAGLSPGSVFKPVIGAIGLTTNTIGHEENFNPSGRSWQKDASWGNYKVTTLKEYGNQVTMKNALIYSDNIYFAKAALKIGSKTLSKELKGLGFGETIPFEYGLTKSQFAQDNKFSSEVLLADTGYGQGQVLVNPIHLASIYSGFVNEGNMIAPYLTITKDKTPTYWKTKVFTKEAAALIQEDMIAVVESPGGTGRSGKIDGITIAAKTGTAEIKASQDDTTGTELGWFAAVTTSKEDKDSLMILTMVEDVKGRGGSHYVIPTVKKAFEEYYK